jgi:RHS repeat-associated protein
VLADGRTLTLAYEPGRVVERDARGTERWRHLDASGRVAALIEWYLPWGGTGSSAKLTTRFFRDADGNVLSTRDADGNVRTFAYNERGQVTRAEPSHAPNVSHPHAYVFCFDGLGRSTMAVTPEGRTVVEARDELGRVLMRAHEPSHLYGTEDATFDYDDPQVQNSRGRLTQAANQHGTFRTTAYDLHGQVAARSVEVAAGAFHATSRYDQLGRPLFVELPFDAGVMATSTSIRLRYDERGLPKQLDVDDGSGPQAWLSVTEYSPSKNPLKATYRNGVTDLWTYQPLSDRLWTQATWGPGNVALSSHVYEYDQNDNPRRIDRGFGASPLAGPVIRRDYGYDSLDRLQWATYGNVGGTNRTFAFAYSHAGNVTRKDDVTYHYDGADQQAVTSRTTDAGAVTGEFGYDRDGQLVFANRDGATVAHTWDGDGRPATTTSGPRSWRYGYSPDGERLLKTLECAAEGCASYTDTYIGPLELRGSQGDLGFFNLELGAVRAQLALRRDSDGRLARDAAADRFYHKDHLGSTVAVTAPDGTAVNIHGDAGRFEYAPYGETLVADATAARIPYRYAGKELDDTSLTYYGARYADTSLGRWISRDPVALVAPEGALRDTQFANLYSFSDNNPMTRVDADGRFPWIVVGIGALAGAAYSYFKGEPVGIRTTGASAAGGAVFALTFVWSAPATIGRLLMTGGFAGMLSTGTEGIVRGTGTSSRDYALSFMHGVTSTMLGSLLMKAMPSLVDKIQKVLSPGELRPATLQPRGGNGKVLRDGEGATAEELSASQGGPTASSRQGADAIKKKMMKGNDEYQCWRCGEKTSNPKNIHLGHRNVPASEGGNLSPQNVCLEGAACNLSAGNRGQPSPGMSCAERGSCGAPYEQQK